MEIVQDLLIRYKRFFKEYITLVAVVGAVDTVDSNFSPLPVDGRLDVIPNVRLIYHF